VFGSSKVVEVKMGVSRQFMKAVSEAVRVKHVVTRHPIMGEMREPRHFVLTPMVAPNSSQGIALRHCSPISNNRINNGPYAPWFCQRKGDADRVLLEVLCVMR
jgi:hypothetical protein